MDENPFEDQEDWHPLAKKVKELVCQDELVGSQNDEELQAALLELLVSVQDKGDFALF